jgi:hypothetical protein
MKVGSKKGDWVLIKKRKNPDGTITDIWAYDPTVTLKPTTVTHPAYQKSASNTTSPVTSPDYATEELTSDKYTAVQDDDTSYLTNTASVSILGRYANVAHLFTFNTAGYENITDITCKWKGYASDSAGYLKVYKATAWETWQSPLPTTDTAYSKSLGNGSAYFYNTSWIKFGLYMTMGYPGEAYAITIKTNYAWIEVTYGIAPPAAKKTMGDGLTWIMS